MVIDGKGARRRSVDIPDTCVKWIEPYALEDGPVAPANAKKLFNLVRALAGFRIASTSLDSLDKESFEEELKKALELQRLIVDQMCSCSAMIEARCSEISPTPSPGSGRGTRAGPPSHS